MPQSLRTAALLSLSVSLIASTAFAQPPQRGPRGPGELRPSRQADRLVVRKQDSIVALQLALLELRDRTRLRIRTPGQRTGLRGLSASGA